MGTVPIAALMCPLALLDIPSYALPITCCFLSPSFNEPSASSFLPSHTLPPLSPLPTHPGGSDVCWVKDDILATAMDSGDVVLWKHGSLGHSLQRLSTLGCHDSMVLGMDGPKGSTLLTHGGDGGVTLINIAEEKVVSQFRGMLLCGLQCWLVQYIMWSTYPDMEVHFSSFYHSVSRNILCFFSCTYSSVWSSV